MIYDELLLISDKFTEQVRKNRLDLVERALGSPPVVGQPESVQSTKIILTLTLDNPVDIFENIQISIDAPAVSDGQKFKIYDGLCPSVAHTPTFLDKVDPQGLSNVVFLVRTAPFDFSADPVDWKKFTICRVNGDGPRIKIEYSISGDSSEIRKRIIGAFPTGELLENTQALFSYTFNDGGRGLNFGIMEYLVLNDPVLSLLYQGTTYGYQKLPDNIKLIRRNESEDVVKLYRVQNDIRIEFEANEDEAKNVLSKIMASLDYYWSKEEEVRNMYANYDLNLIGGLELATDKIVARKPTYVPDGSPFTKLIKGQPVKKNQRSEFYLKKTFAPKNNQPNYNYNVAMQNNPGVSLDTLKELAKRNVVLDPVRWSQAVGESVNKDVFLFSENGLLIPNSRFGLYSRSELSTRRAVFVFVKPNGGCMLIEENKGKKKPGKKYEQINEKSRPGDRYACMIPALKPIFGDKYQLRGVLGGSDPDGIAKCIQASNIGIIPDDTVLDLYRKKTKFYAGYAPSKVGQASESDRSQCVDEHGKFAGETPGQPFPDRPVVCKKDGVIYQFQEDSRYIDLLVQLCLWKYYNIEEKLGVDDFAEKHLEESSSRIIFKPLFSENDASVIPVPDINAIKYTLRQSKQRIVGDIMERFYRRGVYHDGNTVHMNNSDFIKWANSTTKSSEKYYYEPVDTPNQYFLEINNRIAKAENTSALPKNATLMIYSNGKYSTYKQDSTTSIVIGWKNKKGQKKFTVCTYVDHDAPDHDAPEDDAPEDDAPEDDDDDAPEEDITPTDIRRAVADYDAPSLTSSEELAKRRAKGGIGKNPVPSAFWAWDQEFDIMSKIFGVCIYLYQLPYTVTLDDGIKYTSLNKWLKIGDCPHSAPKIAIHGNNKHFQVLNPKMGEESFEAVDKAIFFNKEEAEDLSKLLTDLEENIEIESDDEEVDFLENRLMAARREFNELEKSIATEAKRVENTYFQLQDVPPDGDCAYWAFIRATKNQGIILQGLS